MRFFIDFIHNNPGEKPFVSRYYDPRVLRSLGFNGKVLKNIHASVMFDSLGLDLYGDSVGAKQWFSEQREYFQNEISRIKQADLMSFSHIDLFLFPDRVVEYFADEILVDGKISIDKPKTLDLCRLMIDELFATYPELDGLIIRVGETYLHDMPWHRGNGVIDYNHDDNNSGLVGCDVEGGDNIGGHANGNGIQREQLIKLLMMLREQICVKHNRYCIFRTWDCFPDGFHASAEFYKSVTDCIEPHEKLVFSLKHTALDFWRRVQVNPCLMTGRHGQIVEVQCQREYEGKGAYPMYHIAGVIEGFAENRDVKGLQDIVEHPLFAGLFTWSRGGGWYGPYIKNEFWVDLNVEVLCNWVKEPERGVERAFSEFAVSRGLDGQMVGRFKEVCELSQDAVLKGRYCEAYDRQFGERYVPTQNWLRDDHIGGREYLEPIFEYLYEHNLLEQALDEKREACELWNRIQLLADDVTFPDCATNRFFHVSIEYGRLLYEIIRYGWEVCGWGYQLERSGKVDDHILGIIRQAFGSYKWALGAYRHLVADFPDCCSSLYQFARRVNEHNHSKSQILSERDCVLDERIGLDYMVNCYMDMLVRNNVVSGQG